MTWSKAKKNCFESIACIKAEQKQQSTTLQVILNELVIIKKIK